MCEWMAARRCQEGKDEIEDILSHRGEKDDRQYLVRWKHYGPEDASWVKHDQMSADKLIKRYFQRRKVVKEYDDQATVDDISAVQVLCSLVRALHHLDVPWQFGTALSALASLEPRKHFVCEDGIVHYYGADAWMDGLAPSCPTRRYQLVTTTFGTEFNTPVQKRNLASP